MPVIATVTVYQRMESRKYIDHVLSVAVPGGGCVGPQSPSQINMITSLAAMLGPGSEKKRALILLEQPEFRVVIVLNHFDGLEFMLQFE